MIMAGGEAPEAGWLQHMALTQIWQKFNFSELGSMHVFLYPALYVFTV